MRRIGTIVITVSLLLAFTVFLTAQKENAEQVQLLRAGEFHGDEISAESSDMWLCLYKTGEKYNLIETSILVEKCYDSYLDYPGNDSTGKCISVPAVTNNGGEVIVLLKGIKKYKQGKIITVFCGREKLCAGQSMNWRMDTLKDKKEPGQVNWKLVAFGTFTLGQARQMGHYVDYGMAVVKKFNQRQVLFKHGIVDEFDMPSVLWAGDLDGDDKLDLLIDTTDHYNKREYTLFLSSYAADGELIGKVAQFVTLGC
jgi:hypothetical protein